MKNIILAATALVLIAGTASANDLKTYKATYDERRAAIILEHGVQMSELGEKYTKALDALLAKVKATGDLDKTTAVMDEIKRFTSEKKMPEKPATLLDILNLQTYFGKQVSTYDSNKAEKIVALTSKYDQALDGLQKDLVKTDKLDDAKAVQEERELVKASDIYVSAQKLLTASAVSPPPKAKDKQEVLEITVSALNNQKDPCRTKLVLKKGDNVTITPDAKDQWGGGGSKAGVLCSYKGYGKSKKDWMAMQYQIGKMRDFVSSGKTIAVEEDGELLLFCNDADVGGNVGKISATVATKRE